MSHLLISACEVISSTDTSLTHVFALYISLTDLFLLLPLPAPVPKGLSRVLQLSSYPVLGLQPGGERKVHWPGGRHPGRHGFLHLLRILLIVCLSGDV